MIGPICKQSSAAIQQMPTWMCGHLLVVAFPLVYLLTGLFFLTPLKLVLFDEISQSQDIIKHFPSLRHSQICMVMVEITQFTLATFNEKSVSGIPNSQGEEQQIEHSPPCYSGR